MAVNTLIATNLAAITTFENKRRKERWKQGIQAAKKMESILGEELLLTRN